MKTYTLGDYVNRYANDTFRYKCLTTQRRNGLEKGYPPSCHCVTSLDKGLNKAKNRRAYRDCNFCLGEGINPIPWEDLG